MSGWRRKPKMKKQTKPKKKKITIIEEKTKSDFWKNFIIFFVFFPLGILFSAIVISAIDDIIRTILGMRTVEGLSQSHFIISLILLWISISIIFAKIVSEEETIEVKKDIWIEEKAK